MAATRAELLKSATSPIDARKSADQALSADDRAHLQKVSDQVEALDATIDTARKDAPLAVKFAEQRRGPSSQGDGSYYDYQFDAKSINPAATAKSLACQFVKAAKGAAPTGEKAFSLAGGIKPTSPAEAGPAVRRTPRHRAPVRASRQVPAHRRVRTQRVHRRGTAVRPVHRAEAQVVGGSGTAPALRGLLNASGPLVQTFGANLLATLRSAITKVESTGYVPASFVLSPEAWEAVETTVTTGSGEYVFSASPVDRAARTVWEVPVVTSTALPAGKALLLSQDTTWLATDGRIAFDANVSKGCVKNEVTVRVEGGGTWP